MTRMIKKVQCDDKPLMSIITGLYLYPIAILAHHFGVFEHIAKGNKGLSDVCAFLSIKSRAAKAMMEVIRALDLVKIENNVYKLTMLAEEFLLKKSPNYCGDAWDLIYTTSDNFSLIHLEKVMRETDTPVNQETTLFEESLYNAEKAEAFTHAMHGLSIGAASVWPDKLNLADYHCMLDIGGGSGAHSIGAVTRWPHLRGIIHDIAEVSRVAAKVIKSYGLEKNISIHIGDMWSEPFPDADIHFYSNVFHDWPEQKVIFLIQKSYDALPHGGRMIIHEMLFNDDAPGPLTVAGFNVTMLSWSQGKKYSRSEINKLLEMAGFCDIEILPVFSDFSIMTGVKP
ncbi:Hydroxyneurosporene-O-methyltransferase [Yersinia intermedia]|uniref:Hydroxyneurosporene-O-methyltransferase n=2 Tax=Yersiniaceae TaxID=1903411 RepID=A0A0H5LYF5_YERIN|nr:Hydroxyneurosporene-O-methyltransferase [Yersinia intermedia]